MGHNLAIHPYTHVGNSDGDSRLDETHTSAVQDFNNYIESNQIKLKINYEYSLSFRPTLASLAIPKLTFK